MGRKRKWFNNDPELAVWVDTEGERIWKSVERYQWLSYLHDEARPVGELMKTIVQNAILSKSSKEGYNLDASGVMVREWTPAMGFTAMLKPQKWLYIFNGGTYKHARNKDGWNRLTAKDYRTRPYKDKLGRDYKHGRLVPKGTSRGAIQPMDFLGLAMQNMTGIQGQLKQAVQNALRKRINQPAE